MYIYSYFNNSLRCLFQIFKTIVMVYGGSIYQNGMYFHRRWESIVSTQYMEAPSLAL